MPPKPQFIHDLTTSVELLKDQTGNLQKKHDDLGKAVESLKQAYADLRLELMKEISARYDGLKDAIAELRREFAVINQKLETLAQRMDKWDLRLWGLVVLLVGAVLSLASGLIVTLVRH